MSDTPNLLPCPFCGRSDPIFSPDVKRVFAPAVICPCGCELSGDTNAGTIKQWNVRVDTAEAALAASRAEVECLRRQLAERDRLLREAAGVVRDLTYTQWCYDAAPIQDDIAEKKG